jgi:hypothetical protein
MRGAKPGSDSRGRMWRSRWAAIGAAVAVTFGAGGLVAVNAAGGVGSTTVLTDPARVLDSRDPVNVGLAGPFASRVSQKLQITGSIPTTTGATTVVPAGATGVLLNVTAVVPAAAGFISIRPGDATGLPSTSSLNFTAGQIVPNAVLVALPTGGANAGKIDITYDAFGASGPTTDILIDVVGYTNNSTLAALQAEIDAVEAANATQQTQINAAQATNATQQTQINAKPNTVDVNHALLTERTLTAEVSSTGTKSGTGNFTSSRSSTGSYNVTFDLNGLESPFVFWRAVATTTTSGCNASIPSRVVTSSSGVTVSHFFNVVTTNALGNAADCGFMLFAKAPGPNAVSPPLSLSATASLDAADPTPPGTCTTEGDIVTCVD